jgi:hypothetical protein
MTRISDYFPVSYIPRSGEKNFKGNNRTPKSASKDKLKENKENSKEKEYLEAINELKEDKKRLEKEVQYLINNHNSQILIRDQAISRAQVVVKELLHNLCVQDKKKKREQMYKNSLELANVVQERYLYYVKFRRGVTYTETWREGYKFSEIQDALIQVSRDRDEIEKEKKMLSKRLKIKSGDKPVKINGENLTPISQTEYYELEEIAKIRLQALRKKETDLLSSLELLALERDAHIREVRRIRDEDQVCK